MQLGFGLAHAVVCLVLFLTFCEVSCFVSLMGRIDMVYFVHQASVTLIDTYLLWPLKY